MKQKISVTIDIPAGIELKQEDGTFIVKGPKGELRRRMIAEGVSVAIETQKVSLASTTTSKLQKKMIYTMNAHLKNMIHGVQEPFVYLLKICPGHFPMNVSVDKGVFTIKNFLGEKVPRTLKLKQGVSVKVDGKDVTVEGIDKELVSQTAASIEKLTTITGRDKRIFQDGIYIVSKAGKEIK